MVSKVNQYKQTDILLLLYIYRYTLFYDITITAPMFSLNVKGIFTTFPMIFYEGVGGLEGHPIDISLSLFVNQHTIICWFTETQIFLPISHKLHTSISLSLSFSLPPPSLSLSDLWEGESVWISVALLPLYLSGRDKCNEKKLMVEGKD